MHRSFLAVLLVACVIATTADAQSRTSSASATATVIASLSLTKVQDMDFSTHFASDGQVTSSGPGAKAARWNGVVTQGSSLSMSFVLPSALTSSKGGSVPFSCGSLGASSTWAGGGPGPFNPALGLANSGPVNSPDGSFNVLLGEDGSPTGDAGNCVVNLTGSAPGSYTGTITVTVNVL